MLFDYVDLTKLDGIVGNQNSARDVLSLIVVHFFGKQLDHDYTEDKKHPREDEMYPKHWGFGIHICNRCFTKCIVFAFYVEI